MRPTSNQCTWAAPWALPSWQVVMKRPHKLTYLREWGALRYAKVNHIFHWTCFCSLVVPKTREPKSKIRMHSVNNHFYSKTLIGISVLYTLYKIIWNKFYKNIRLYDELKLLGKCRILDVSYKSTKKNHDNNFHQIFNETLSTYYSLFYHSNSVFCIFDMKSGSENIVRSMSCPFFSRLAIVHFM